MRKPTMHDFKVNCVDGAYLGVILLAHERPNDKYTVVLVWRIEGKEVFSILLVYCNRATTPPRKESALQELS